MREEKRRGDVQCGEGEDLADAEGLRGGVSAVDSITSCECPTRGLECPAAGHNTVDRDGGRDRDDDRDLDRQHHDAAFARGVAAEVEFPC